MKTKMTFGFCFVFLLIMQSAFAQECVKKLNLFNQSAKIKDYKTAMPYYNDLVKDCPSTSVVTYQYGEKMLKSLIKKEQDKAKKDELLKKAITNYKLRLKHFPEKSNSSDIYAEIATLKYENKIGTKEEQFESYKKAWNSSEEHITDPKSLLIYFSLLVNLYDDNKREIKEVFDTYKDVSVGIEKLQNDRAAKLKKLIKKKKNGSLTSRENKILKNSEIYLDYYAKIQSSLDSKLSKLADCETLIPLYEDKFEEEKGNIDWLQDVASQLFTKKCTSSDLFVKVVEAQHKLQPSAETALYLGKLSEKSKDYNKALKYYNESADLENSSSDKANVLYNMGNIYKRRGQYSKARSEYRRALDLKPSMGYAYLKIAEMYADSANNCADKVFDKLAVYWLAEDYARRAGKVQPSIKSSANNAADSYAGRAPQKSDIFQENMSGKTVSYSNCWIGESVKVPNI